MQRKRSMKRNSGKRRHLNLMRNKERKLPTERHLQRSVKKTMNWIKSKVKLMILCIG
jgi:hypothetical protein